MRIYVPTGKRMEGSYWSGVDFDDFVTGHTDWLFQDDADSGMHEMVMGHTAVETAAQWAELAGV